jgi:hypothetical protein
VSCLKLWLHNLLPFGNEDENEEKITTYNGLCAACEIASEMFFPFLDTLLEVVGAWKSPVKNKQLGGYLCFRCFFFYIFYFDYVFFCCLERLFNLLQNIRQVFIQRTNVKQWLSFWESLKPKVRNKLKRNLLFEGNK